MTSKGQVTVPAKLRTALGLKSGDKLLFRQDSAGRVHLEALSSSLGDLVGIVTEGPDAIDGEHVARWIDDSRGARWRSDQR